MARSQHKINSSFVNIHHALHSRMAGAGHEISDAALRAVALARAARVSAGRRSDEHYRRLKRPPMWAGLPPDSKGDPTADDTEGPDGPVMAKSRP